MKRGRSKLLLSITLSASVVVNGVLILLLLSEPKADPEPPAPIVPKVAKSDRDSEISYLRSSITEVRKAIRRFQPANRRSSLLEKGFRAVPPAHLKLLLATSKEHSLSDGGEVESINGPRGVTDAIGGLHGYMAQFLRIQDDEWRKLHDKIKSTSLELRKRAEDHHETRSGQDGRLIHRVPAEVARSQDLYDELIGFARKTIGEERTALFVELLPNDRYLTFDHGAVEISLDPKTRQKSLVTISPSGTRTHRLISFTIDDRYKPLIAKEYWAPQK